MKKRNVLISVSDKTNIVAVAQRLVALEFNIIASGGTADLLDRHGIAVTQTATIINRYAKNVLTEHNIEVTPELVEALGGAILDHRVVTLSREIHGGLLARGKHVEELAKLLIPWIHMTIVDFYPFAKTVAKPGITLEEAIEQIDVGGPIMAHSTAKGAADGRTIICDLSDCEWVLTALEQNPEHDLDQTTKNKLAAKADFVVSKYCMDVATYRSEGAYMGIFGISALICKYGENVWQKIAGLFSQQTNDPLALDKFKRVGGDDPSYNNLCDLDRLVQTITHIAAAFEKNRGWVPKIAVAVKHGNPCGAAFSDSGCEALKLTMGGDPVAVFGGSVITNFPVGAEEAEQLAVQKLDAIIAPDITLATIAKLERKHGKCRFLVNPALGPIGLDSLDKAKRFRYVRGGFLLQDNYIYVLDLNDPELDKKCGIASPHQENSMLLAWAISSTSNSNTITLVQENYLIGNGVGQQDRVGAAQLALIRTVRPGHKVEGAVACSDSYFPYPDGPQALVDAGVKVILTSSGSIKDKDTIGLCAAHSIFLYMIPDTKGRGFYGH